MADVLAARRAYALAHVGTRACDTPRDGATANATMLADALFAPRVAAPEVAREDDDTPDDLDDLLRVLPERERAATLVAEALDRELDHAVARAMLDDARTEWERACRDYEARATEPLYRALLNSATERYDRWLAVREALNAATLAEQIETARWAAEVARA